MDSRSGKRRNKEAQLASLYESCYDRISRYAFVRLGDQAEAEDLAGEVFLKALESLDSYKERGVPMQAWLFKIAHNLIVDHFRKSAKQKTVSIDTVNVKTESDPEEQAMAELEIARVMNALGRLTESQQKVIELRVFGEMTSEEAGHILNKRAGTVRELQSAAIRALRNLLNEEPPLNDGAK
ncbi:MAG: sigma-70 family RNA polymerase sigma factor [Dehalococcoidia bacterium]|nr:MAG: sigma-70 family RNA polymerase sigma factor [Dehalococcoidia bacterium]